MKQKPQHTRRVMAVVALALTVHSAHAAVVIASAGADLTTNDAWRTVGVTKALDGDGNNIYGSAGYFTSTTTPWIANSLPSYATVGNSAGTLVFNAAGNAGVLYKSIDNPANPLTDVETGVVYRTSTTTTNSTDEHDFYTITLTAATSFRLGIITDNADVAAVSPSSLRVRQTVGGSANSGLISAGTDRDLDVDYYFIDITGGQIGDTFVVSGVQAPGTNTSNGVGGLTFDTIPEPSSALLGALGLLALLRRRR